MSQKTNFLVKKFICCPLAILLNMIVAYIFYDKLRLPLFLDTIFTVAITFYFGLIPGLFVALCYNAFNALTLVARGFPFDPFSVLFGICGAIIVFVTWFLSRKREEFDISPGITMLHLVLIAMISSFCVVISSGIIDFVRYSLTDIPDRMAPVKEYTDSFLRQNFSLFASCILGQIPVSVTDRLITTFAGYGVYKIMLKFWGDNVNECQNQIPEQPKTVESVIE